MIRLAAVEQRFGSFRLSVDLEAQTGAYLVILGPSGCGKSLLLGTVAGLHAPAAGRILLDGEEVTAWPPERRQVGLVFQRSSLFPHLSVRENLAFGLRVRGVPRPEVAARVDELVETFGLGELLDRQTTTLSGGEAQRVALARALAVKPRVLLLDEPLSLLDHNARLELQEELRRLHGLLGFTALHVTHHREEARALGGRCAVMLGGRIVQEGPIDALLESPHCAFVARFLGLSGRPASPSDCGEACLARPGHCDRRRAEG